MCTDFTKNGLPIATVATQLLVEKFIQQINIQGAYASKSSFTRALATIGDKFQHQTPVSRHQQLYKSYQSYIHAQIRMASQQLQARLRFLDEAARLLAPSLPSTSAHLSYECNNLLLENDQTLPESRTMQVCSACGTIMIPGKTMKMSMEGKSSPKRRSSAKPSIAKKTRGSTKQTVEEKEPTPRFMVHECFECNRVTRQPLLKASRPTRLARPTRPKTSAIPNIAVTLPSDSSGSSPVVQTPGSSHSVNPNSNKRAKARRKKGLQAMLASSKSKASDEATSGLNHGLMDFLKGI
ncbi:MAG: hypothetical protein M1834_001547 [Cirrosporium novae-zelandiae]|nr:MAG: hypothetical protein M1834_004064 [Cirrosporium novae-zelandiae]KAI9735532.1 MAG: hypothetical protein M1834_001547 [Cirrosporium novae-zelandiae]